ncbi:M15 family metallopeptidase [Glaesserella sp.]|uniref:M15 family metallopeptidase n=1 Tax=Glaesserella sp. TaxID=2094731 RepID=UPI00359F6EE2
MKKFLICAAFLPSIGLADDVAFCLEQAYPDIQVEQAVIHFADGGRLPIGTLSDKPFRQKLVEASVADQLSQRYPLEFAVPQQYQDAGRIRHDAFFKHLYGSTRVDIEQNLIAINWAPSRQSVQFNRRNHAAAQLQKVGEEIVRFPELVDYVNRPLGTFNYRNIAGTSRLSAHSFGIAIDFQLPKHLHHYWRWSGCQNEDTVCPYPTQLLNDPKLNRIVRIFEKHGFIWGGKWASYDSVHFEYRPELVIQACR